MNWLFFVNQLPLLPNLNELGFIKIGRKIRTRCIWWRNEGNYWLYWLFITGEQRTWKLIRPNCSFDSKAEPLAAAQREWWGLHRNDCPHLERNVEQTARTENAKDCPHHNADSRYGKAHEATATIWWTYKAKSARKDKVRRAFQAKPVRNLKVRRLDQDQVPTWSPAQIAWRVIQN